MRKLTAADVKFTIAIEPEYIPVRGNAMASDDPDLDRQLEDQIIAELDRGNVEAWCFIRVTATWRSHSGTDTLGGCSHLPGDGRPSLAKQVEQTIEDHDMRANALEDLNNHLATVAADLATLES